jgi:YD repeat-containing protein
MTSLSYPNQITAKYVYDDAGRLTSIAHSAGEATVAFFSYSVDKVGNRTSKTANAVDQYLFDTLYRLLTVTSSKPEKFGYDTVGNRLNGPGLKDAGYLHNAGNQMLRGRKLAYGGHDLDCSNKGNPHYQTDSKFGHTFWSLIPIIGEFLDPVNMFGDATADPSDDMI